MDSRSAKRFSPKTVERIHRLFDDKRVVWVLLNSLEALWKLKKLKQ